MSKSVHCCDPFKIHGKKVTAVICYQQKCIYSVSPMSHTKTGRKINVLKSSDTTYRFSRLKKTRAHVWCAVHKATTHVVSLLFSSCEGVLEMLCSTGTSPGICMIFFRHLDT